MCGGGYNNTLVDKIIYIIIWRCTSPRMVKRVDETCSRNTMYITYDTFIHLFAFVVFVTYLIAQCTVMHYLKKKFNVILPPIFLLFIIHNHFTPSHSQLHWPCS